MSSFTATRTPGMPDLPPGSASSSGRHACSSSGDRFAHASRWLVSRIKDASIALVVIANIVVLFGSAFAVLMGFRLLVVTGGSMAPFVNAGDLAIVRPVEVSAVRAGDVISYLPAGAPHLVTHRVIAVTLVQGKTYFQTKGDANESADPNLVPPDALVGRLVSHAPALVTQMLTAPWRPVLPAIVVVWMAAPFLPRRSRRRTRAVVSESLR